LMAAPYRACTRSRSSNDARGCCLVRPICPQGRKCYLSRHERVKRRSWQCV